MISFPLLFLHKNFLDQLPMLRHNLHNRSSRPQTRSATTPTRTDEEKSSFAGPSFTTLAPVLGKVADTFATFNKKFEKVKEVSDGLSNFNKSFGAFLAGMVVNDAVVKWPHVRKKTEQAIFVSKLFKTNRLQKYVLRHQPKNRSSCSRNAHKRSQ